MEDAPAESSKRARSPAAAGLSLEEPAIKKQAIPPKEDAGPSASGEAQPSTTVSADAGAPNEEEMMNLLGDAPVESQGTGTTSSRATPTKKAAKPFVKGGKRDWFTGGKDKDAASGSGERGQGGRRGRNAERSNKGARRGGEAGAGQDTEPGEPVNGDGNADEDGEGEGDGKKRLPKKRVALLLGYCGTGYSGMQIQTHGSKTIEGDMFAALVKAGAISEDNSSDHRKVDVQRSARTDAGVHAAGNVISLKMILDPPLPEGFATVTDYVNSFLPDQIRMWGFVRAMKSFQARLSCDSRVYEYLLPSYCLLPPASSDPISKRLNESSPGWRDTLGSAAAFADETPELPELGPDEKLDPKQRGEFERRRAWRIDEGTLKRFRDLVAQYKGTHNYHNYTVGKPFNDRTVKRFMIQLEVRDPIVHGDIEWVSVRIHGQSFMLHQIRKMMSLAMLACRTASPPSLIPETYGPKRIHIPKAPPLGLLLQAPQFRTYNERIKTKTGGLQEDRDPVDFTPHLEKMEEFKRKWIYERLRQDELDANVFHKWIRQIDCSASAAFSFLNTSGVIPAEASVMRNKRDAATAGKDGSKVGSAEAEAADVDSDEEVDLEALRKGELEG